MENQTSSFAMNFFKPLCIELLFTEQPPNNVITATKWCLFLLQVPDVPLPDDVSGSRQQLEHDPALSPIHLVLVQVLPSKR